MIFFFHVSAISREDNSLISLGSESVPFFHYDLVSEARNRCFASPRGQISPFIFVLTVFRVVPIFNHVIFTIISIIIVSCCDGALTCNAHTNLTCLTPLALPLFSPIVSITKDVGLYIPLEYKIRNQSTSSIYMYNT